MVIHNKTTQDGTEIESTNTEMLSLLENIDKDLECVPNSRRKGKFDEITHFRNETWRLYYSKIQSTINHS
jgi:hypothetical protein